MKLLRVFNNNLVLARDETGTEVILTGRGLGFQTRPGQEVDAARIVRKFVPDDGRDPDHLAELLAGLPPEHIQLVGEAMTATGLDHKAAANPTLVIALADHLSFAIKRHAHGKDIEYPLEGEVRHLYAEEYDQGLRILAAVNDRLADPLPAGEAVALALHLVNSGIATGDLSYTYTMTGVIQQMIAVIENHYGLVLDTGSVSVGRLITHLRYLFVRIHQHRQLNREISEVGKVIRASQPRALECALRLETVIELRLGASLTDDEVSYLTLHVARVIAEVTGT